MSSCEHFRLCGRPAFSGACQKSHHVLQAVQAVGQRAARHVWQLVAHQHLGGAERRAVLGEPGGDRRRRADDERALAPFAQIGGGVVLGVVRIERAVDDPVLVAQRRRVEVPGLGVGLGDERLAPQRPLPEWRRGRRLRGSPSRSAGARPASASGMPGDITQASPTRAMRSQRGLRPWRRSRAGCRSD